MGRLYALFTSKFEVFYYFVNNTTWHKNGRAFMKKRATIIAGALIVLVLFSLLGCASGPRGKINIVESPTEAALRQNWNEYTVYYRRSLALIFKIKDDSKIELDSSWVEITSAGMMEKTGIIDSTTVREILGANDRKFGYLVQRYLDSAYAGIVDEKTIKMSYYYRRTSGR
jgi:hypothetical protein